MPHELVILAFASCCSLSSASRSAHTWRGRSGVHTHPWDMPWQQSVPLAHCNPCGEPSSSTQAFQPTTSSHVQFALKELRQCSLWGRGSGFRLVLWAAGCGLGRVAGAGRGRQQRDKSPAVSAGEITMYLHIFRTRAAPASWVMPLSCSVTTPTALSVAGPLPRHILVGE